MTGMTEVERIESELDRIELELFQEGYALRQATHARIVKLIADASKERGELSLTLAIAPSEYVDRALTAAQGIVTSANEIVAVLAEFRMRARNMRLVIDRLRGANRQRLELRTDRGVRRLEAGE